ncbi:polysaccharide deacetylase family protein [Paraclostridium benzoelyticum]|uniref:polysaccharide deacetylase family protein n=1 Tax=Paraclostridium benzoelyticum TaxID=1629550 RepID=UPI0031CDA64B
MMCKRYIVIFLIILLVFSNIGIGFANIEKKENALIIYENQKTFSYKENTINHLNELLYRFNKSVDSVYINDYKKGSLKQYDSIFVINIENEINDRDLLEDLSNYEHGIYWIGNGIEDFLSYSDKYDLIYEKKINSINELNYKGNKLTISSSDYFNVVNTIRQNSKILATMKDSYKEYPYVINNKNLYFISNYKIDQSFIFEDTLNDFYNIKNFEKGKVFVRIEDVHLFRDKDNLKEIADYLYSEGIPFMVALIPAYVNSKTGKINTIKDDPEFIKTIKYMQDRGGSVVLHGYMHSLDKREISGEGYEFWDMEKDEPISENMEEYVKDRVLSGLRLCVEKGIYPIAFEAPHYAMDQNGYTELKKYFSTYVGQYQNNNENFATSSFPYIIEGSKNFNILIPENLGYIERDNKFSIDIIKNNFYKLSMVRGYTGGFFFHPYMNLDYLKQVISYLKENDSEFLNLKDINNYVKIDDINIRSKDGKIDVTYDKNKSNEKSKSEISFENSMSNINKIIVIFVSTVLVIFTIIFIFFRFINRRKFRRR